MARTSTATPPVSAPPTPTPEPPTVPKPRKGVFGKIDRARAKVDEVKDATETQRQQARMLKFRNRRAAQPWYAAASTAAIGATGALATEFTDGPVLDLAVAGGTGAVALTSGWLLYKRHAEAIEKAGMTGRVKTGAAAACVWCLTETLVGASQTEMWLALGLGTVALSAKWWQRIRPGYPTNTDLVLASDDTAAAAKATKATNAAQTAIKGIIDSWNSEVATPTGHIPGSELLHPTAIERGAQFTVKLVPGRHTIESLQNAVVRIGGAIGYFAEAITFDRGDTPSEAIMRVVTGAALVASDYDGPQIITDGENVWIEIGPYLDGEGTAKWHVSGPNSVNSGFILGSKGSGKSRVLELIAIGLRHLGMEIWWFDPQSGASSTALKDNADWPLMGLDSDDMEDPELAYVGNALNLLHAVQRAAKIREAENVAWGLDGFTHTRERPAVAIMIDECHILFNLRNPETGNTFGHDFGELDRIVRKLGLLFICASQIFTMDTFGNSAALRSGLITGNLLIMRMMEKSHCGLLPGSAPSPLGLPKGGGFGYAIDTDRDHIMWRAGNVKDAAWWLSSMAKATLDARLVKAAGRAYRNRHETIAKHSDRAAAALAAFDDADADTALSLLKVRRPVVAQSVMSPAAPGTQSSVVRTLPIRPSASPDERFAPDAVPQDVPLRDLTEKEGQFLAVLAEQDEWHVRDLAVRLGISEVMVRKYLRALESRITKVESGVYRAK